MPSSQDQTSTNTLPESFVQEVRQAEAVADGAKLILLGLEVKGAPWEADAVALIAEAQQAIPPVDSWAERVMLFTGHRVDSANRKTPRFPASKEEVAREAIRGAIKDQLGKSSNDKMLGVAGGANGGDLLFLEACDDLRIPTEMLITLPQEQFVKESVDNENKTWTERFYAQVGKHSEIPVLATSTELPPWLAFKSGYDIWQRNNFWLLSAALSYHAQFFTVIALWDGQAGDAPGGTEHMVEMAKERGATVIHLDTKDIFGLTRQ